jgi:hypothetical protein
MTINLQEKKPHPSKSSAVKDSIASFAKGDQAGVIALYGEVSDPARQLKGKSPRRSSITSTSANTSSPSDG